MNHFDWYEFYKVAEELSQKDDEWQKKTLYTGYSNINKW